jgi:hypothetical protein
MKDQRTKSSRIELEERLERVEELLCSGFAPERILRVLVDEYGISSRQGRNYLTKVYKRWQRQSLHDAPHRREMLYRKAERFYGKAMANKQWTAAAHALALLAKLAGAFTAQSPDRKVALAQLGPIPKDPTAALTWTQQVMLRTIAEVYSDATIDPLTRARYIAELGGRMGMTHAKALVEARLDAIEQRLMPPADAASRLEADTTSWPATSRLGAGDPDNVPIR